MEILLGLKVGVDSDDACVYAQELNFYMRDAEIRSDRADVADGDPRKRPPQSPVGALVDAHAHWRAKSPACQVARVRRLAMLPIKPRPASSRA
jgi:hypothetical protein